MMALTAGAKYRPSVLLVEDDLADQDLVRRAFEKSDSQVDLRIKSNGQEAMDYLLRQGWFGDTENAPKPDLILLDLNMPVLSGHEMLKQLAAHDELRSIPVVVMTTSADQVEVQTSYNLGTNSFIVKPSTFDALVDTIRKLECYWFESVTLPS